MTVATVEVPNKALFARKEVCRLMGVNRETFAQMVQTGLLRTYRPPGFSRKSMVTRASVIATLEAMNRPDDGRTT